MNQMDLVEIDERLLDHLTIEFGRHGHDAVEFIRTARHLLGLDVQARPARAPESVAYCLREATKRLLDSVDDVGGGEWRSASRRVTEARRKYEQIRGVPGEDDRAALDELLRTIDDIEVVHERESLHERRLVALVLSRSGAQPLASGTAPVRVYVEMLGELDRAVHRRVSFDHACDLWNKSLIVLAQLFQPPELRHARLEELAAVEAPTSADVQQLLPLLATPQHLRHFLQCIQVVEWLDVLTEVSVLDPPPGDGPWHAFEAVQRLAERDADGIVRWLRGMYARFGDEPRCAWSIVRACLDVGPDAFDIVEDGVRSHVADPNVVALGIRAVESVDPSSPVVERLADLLLNEEPWTRLGYVEPVVEAIVKGLTNENVLPRLKLICWKLGAVPEDEGSRRWLLLDLAGPLDDWRDNVGNDRFATLLGALRQIALDAREWVPVAELLAAVASLPADIADRLRPWVLSTAANVDIATIVEELTIAIGTRDPCGDDLALIERVVAELPPEDYIGDWRAQLGDPPSVAEASAALRDRTLQDAWLRAYHWAGLIPEAAVGDWASPVAVIASRLGPYGPDRFRHRPRAEVATGRSPYSQDELTAVPPLDACRRVATWRPEANAWLVGARELARTLEAVVKENPTDWLESPLRVATELHHPTYIAHYLRAAAATVDQVTGPVEEWLDVIALVDAEPWPAEALGRDNYDYDPDWRGCRRASVDLLKALADVDAGFAGRDDEVWALLEREARDRSEPSGILSGARDPLDSAINRPCTRALEALLSVMAYDYRQSETVRQEALRLLEDCLTVEGEDGAEYRAIIATRLAFLKYVSPSWFDEAEQLLVGSAAPDDLGQLTVDLTIKWSRPNPWLLESHRGLVVDAVRRDVEHALDHFLVGMLWQVPGYQVQQTIAALRHPPALLSKAGEMLSRLLWHGDVDPAHIAIATDFWDEAIATRQRDGLEGFGWMAEVEAMDETTWTSRTLSTLEVTKGSIDWSHKVAERTASQRPSPPTLAIMNLLVRGAGDPWHQRQNIEVAVQHLQASDRLADTTEYRRLRTSLQERNAL